MSSPALSKRVPRRVVLRVVLILLAVGGILAVHAPSALAQDQVTDCASNTSTVCNLSVSGNNSGEIGVDDVDWFMVRLNAGITYRFDVRGNESTDPGGTLNYPQVAVINLGGSTILTRDYNSRNAGSARVNFIPAANATYYIQVSGNEANGTYTVSANSISGNRPPVIDNTLSHNLQEHGVMNLSLNSWDLDSSDNVESYELDGPDADHFSINQSTGILSLNIEPDFERPEDLDENNVYEFDVRVHSGTGQRNLSSSAVFTLNITDNNSEVPGPPRNFRVVTVSLNRFDVAWDHPAVNKGPDREKYTIAVVVRGYGDLSIPLDRYKKEYGAITTYYGRNRVFKLKLRAENAEGKSDWVVIPALRLDECDHSTSTECSLDIGENKTGRINTDWHSTPDFDWFSVDLQAGTKYQIDVKGDVLGDNGGTLNDPVVRLLNSSGGEIVGDDNSGTGNNAQLSYTPTDTGTYYVEVGGERVHSGNDPGGEGRSYTVSVNIKSLGCPSDTDTSSNLSIGGSQTGEVYFYEFDCFRVMLSANTTYRFDVRGNESTDSGGTLNYPRVAVFDSSGGIIVRDYNSGMANSARVNFRPSVGGTYYVQASGNGVSGTYTISAVEISGNLPPEIVGDRRLTIEEHGMLNHTLTLQDSDSSDNIEGYELDGPDAAHFSFNESTNTLSLNIEPDFERPVDSDGDNLYEVDVRVHSGTGQRNLSSSAVFTLNITDNNSEVPGPPRNFKVVTVSSRVFLVEWDHPAVNKGPDRERYIIRFYPPGYNAMTKLVSPNSNRFQSTDSGNFNSYNVGIRTRNAEGESDWVVIPALRLDECDHSTSTTCSLDIGENKTGWMNTDWYTAPDFDWFSVDLQAGVKYQIDVKGDVLGDNGGTLNDPVVRLLNSSGGEIVRDDNSGTGNNAQLSYTPTDTGTYYVEVRGERVHSGNDPRGEGRSYTVSVKSLGCPSDTSTPCTLSVGGNRTDEVGVQEADWFRVMLQANTTYRFDVRGNESTDSGGTLNYPQVAVFDSSGGILTRDYNSEMANSARVNFKPSAGGTYYVQASGNRANGTYTISATEISGNSPPEIIGNRSLILQEHGMLNHALTFQDADSSDNLESYELDGPDAAHFSFNEYTGVLSLNIEPNFERPVDSGGENLYEVDVRAHSGTGQRKLSFSAVFTLNITDNNSEAPGPPRNFRVIYTTSTQFRVSWSRPAVNNGPSLGNYKIDVHTRGFTSSTFSLPSYIDSFEPVIATDSRGPVYFYRTRIRATNAEGESDWVVIPAIRLDECNHATNEACSLNVGQKKTEWINTGWTSVRDRDWFSVDLQAGVKYQIDVKGNVSGDNGGTLNNPAVKLLNSSSSKIAEDDNSGTGNNAQLSYTPTDTGTYYLEVRGETVDRNNDPLGEGRSYTISVKPAFCDRTAQVRDAILETISSTDCSAVNSTQLAGIQSLNLTSKNISALKEGDFDNLTGLVSLYLSGNNLSSLPEGIFDDLTLLEFLNLGENNLSSLPEGIFDDLTLLEFLNLGENNLTSLPEGIFDDLTLLEFLNLGENNLTSLPEGIFDSGRSDHQKSLQARNSNYSR